MLTIYNSWAYIGEHRLPVFTLLPMLRGTRAGHLISRSKISVRSSEQFKSGGTSDILVLKLILVLVFILFSSQNFYFI